MKKIRFSIAVALAIIAIAIPVEVALASTANWYGPVGGVSVHAQKNVSIGAYQWYTDLWSFAAQSINIIGYTYWTVGEYCPGTGTWAYWHQYPGDYRTYTTQYYTAAYINYRGCSGTIQYWGQGNHDFAYGGGHIYHYVETYEQR
jgi:hypothetical protein